MTEEITETPAGKIAMDILESCQRHTDKNSVAITALGYAFSILVNHSDQLGFHPVSWSDVPEATAP